jgi:hypothetical protein
MFYDQLCLRCCPHPRFKYRLLFQKPASSNRASRRGSSRPVRGKLRRFHDIENVIVEEPFTLFKPSGGNSGGDAEEDRQAGDGCYVTTTVHNRRYYGLLVDQDALKNASLLWFEEEAAGLDLNRRMKMLREVQASRSDIESQTNGDNGGEKKRPVDGGSSENLAKETKRIKLEPGEEASTSIAPVPDAVPSNIPAVASNPSQGVAAEVGKLLTPGHQRQVQKFRYVPPTSKKNADIGYRILLATYADIEAASEDDQEAARLIDKACQAGGGYVGKYYYQFEVRKLLGSSRKKAPERCGLTLDNPTTAVL